MSLLITLMYLLNNLYVRFGAQRSTAHGIVLAWPRRLWRWRIGSRAVRIDADLIQYINLTNKKCIVPTAGAVRNKIYDWLAWRMPEKTIWAISSLYPTKWNGTLYYIHICFGLFEIIKFPEEKMSALKLANSGFLVWRRRIDAESQFPASLEKRRLAPNCEPSPLVLFILCATSTKTMSHTNNVTCQYHFVGHAKHLHMWMRNAGAYERKKFRILFEKLSYCSL